MGANNSQEFEIVVDFKRGEGDPTRVFRAMSNLIESLASLDQHLLSSFDVALDATLILDEIQTGSLKARFYNLIAGIPDEAIKEGDWKKILGHFLLQGKFALLEWLNEQDKTVTRDDVRALEARLSKIAEDTNLKQLPAYTAPRPETLLTDMRSVQESLDCLGDEDTAVYRHGEREVAFNRNLDISNEVILEVLTEKVITRSTKQIVKVKKPDYLGWSMWSFQYAGRSIDAKITDTEWLSEFQSRQVDVRPGDSLRVLLYEETSYGYEGEIVHTHYVIKKVYKVIRPPSQPSIGF